MAHQGLGFFDSKGHYYKTPDEATASDLAGLLGRIGEGDSLAPGIAVMLLQKRSEIEAIFADHDVMCAERERNEKAAADTADNVTPLPGMKSKGTSGE